MSVLPPASHTHGAPHVRSLDALRAIAALLVVFEHTPLSLKTWWWAEQLQLRFAPGYMGVDLFFVLSGFLITRILVADKAAGAPLRWFWARRALRIFPAFYLLVAIVALVRPGPEIPWVATYLANLYFADLTVPFTPLSHTWSLAIEEHFYLVWPLVVYGVTRPWARVAAAWTAIVAAVLVSLHFASYGLLEGFTLSSNQTPTRVLSLCAGALLAFHESSLLRHWRIAIPVALVAVVGGYQWCIHGLLDAQWRVYAGTHRLVGLGLVSTGIVALTILADRLPKVPAIDAPFAVLRYLGRISYGLYLYHLPIFFALDLEGRAARGELDGGRMAGAVALSIAAASASYHLFERRLTALGARFRGRR